MQKKENALAIIWRFIYPVLVYLGVEFFIEFVMMIGYMVYRMTGGNVQTSEMAGLVDDTVTFIYRYSLHINIIAAAVLVPLFGLFMKRDIKRDMFYGRYVRYTPFDKRWLLILPVAGFTAAMGFNHVVPGVFVVLGELAESLGISIDFYESYNEVSQILYSGPLLIQILASSVAAPLIEEFLFRGLLYKRIRTYLKMVPSMLISAVIFGLMHGNVVQFLYAFILGLFFAFVYEKFKTIWAPVIFHAGANLIAVIVQTIMPESGVGLGLGSYMLLVVIELAVTFLLLMLVEYRVNRQPLPESGNGEE